jgi:hypothetical protein
MVLSSPRKPLTAWIIGLVVVLAIEAYLAYAFFGAACNAPALAQFMVLIALPGVYLVLMYLTLKKDTNG